MCEDSEDIEDSAVPTQAQTGSSRPQRQRQMPARLQDCDIIADNEVNEGGDLVHLAFLADSEPVNDSEALKNPKWIATMKEELKSIESNKT